MDLLQVKGIHKKDERGFAIKNISFTQSAEKNIAIAGETGSGKSTVLKIIAGLVQPDSGEVIFQGEKVMGPADKLVPGHKGIVYLSQLFELPNFLRVEQIMEYANEWPDGKAEKLFELCRIGHLFKRRTDQLSGGERQRIAIARLLIMDPKLFLLDEPFSNMDLTNKNLLKAIITDISNELKISFIMVSHDPIDTLSWSDEIIVMQNGELLENNSAQQIYEIPASTYTAGLFGKYNEIDGLIIRPEACRIVPGGELSGKVTAVRYYGHYFEADVLVGKNLLITRSAKQEAVVGENVNLRIYKPSSFIKSSL